MVHEMCVGDCTDSCENVTPTAVVSRHPKKSGIVRFTFPGFILGLQLNYSFPLVSNSKDSTEKSGKNESLKEFFFFKEQINCNRRREYGRCFLQRNRDGQFEKRE